MVMPKTAVEVVVTEKMESIVAGVAEMPMVMQKKAVEVVVTEKMENIVAVVEMTVVKKTAAIVKKMEKMVVEGEMENMVVVVGMEKMVVAVEMERKNRAEK